VSPLQALLTHLPPCAQPPGLQTHLPLEQTALREALHPPKAQVPLVSLGQLLLVGLGVGLLTHLPPCAQLPALQTHLPLEQTALREASHPPKEQVPLVFVLHEEEEEEEQELLLKPGMSNGRSQMSTPNVSLML